MTTSYKPHLTLAPAQDLLAKLEHVLLRIDRQQPAAADHVADAAQALETVPLATDDFALARNRLCNAAAYLDQGEWGAARYEVDLVLHGLRAFIDRFDAVPAVA